LNEKQLQQWFQRRKQSMAIERDERVGSRTANLIELNRSEELCLTLAIECGPAVAGYRLTRVATVERTVEEFGDEAFAASGGRIAILLRFPRPGYYALSADVVCPVGRAGSMLKLSARNTELCRIFSSAKANPKTTGVVLNVRILVS
jgi:hypothetical protein